MTPGVETPLEVNLRGGTTKQSHQRYEIAFMELETKEH